MNQTSKLERNISNDGGSINLNELKGYEYIVDTSGETKAVQRSTGEVTETVWMCVPIGSRIYTPESLASRNDYLNQKENNDLRRASNKDLGKFFFVSHDEDFKDLLPQTVTRLIFLNTFINYENNKLMLTERTPMQRKDLSKVLGVSKAVITGFWKEVSPKYIQEEDDGLIFTNTDIFIRRRLNQRGKYHPYQKFYINGIRTLYRATDVTNHKHLGYVFKMLPFVNLEFNVLCKNPMEKDLSQIEFLSLAEFCTAIDYDISQLNRLLNIYKAIKFNVNGAQEKFCAFTYDGIDRKSARIFVNPHILYNGTDYNRVKVLGAFCKD